MKSVGLFLITVLIWGTTWYAVRLQLGNVESEVSVFYRFVIAAISMVIYCKLRKISLRFPLRQHCILFLMGCCMFSVHYVFVYHATHFIVSGMVALVFSTVGLFNILNNYIIFRHKPTLRTVLGAFLGVLGVSTFFWHEIFNDLTQFDTAMGVGLSLVATYIFSMGNIISRYSQDKKMPIVSSVALSMCYGVLVLFVYTQWINPKPYVVPDNLSYFCSLLYLAIPGSVFAFLFYLTLIARIGPTKAGYATVFIPMVALFVSSLFEGYQLSLEDAIGATLVVLGCILVMAKRRLGINRA